MSLMNIRKNRGPRTLPCGAPLVTERMLDRAPLIFTRGVRSVEYDLNKSKKLLSKPIKEFCKEDGMRH